MQNADGHFGNGLAISLKWNTHLPSNPGSHTLGIYPGEIKNLHSYKNLYRNTYTERIQMEEWINKLWYIHKMKYYSE